MSDEDEVKEFTFMGMDPILLAEDFDNDHANGTRLWEAGMLLSRYIEKNMPDKMQGKTIVELGAGTGLFSVFLGRLRAKEVIACDNVPIVLKLLKQNIATNKVSKNVKALQFDWGDKDAVEKLRAKGEADFVMGADCVFSLSATKLLVECLARLMETSHPVGFMSIETRDNAVTDCFVAGMKEANFDIGTVSLRGIDKQYLHPDISIYRFQRK